MKKLMIIAALMCAAVSAQAGSFTWSVSGSTDDMDNLLNEGTVTIYYKTSTAPNWSDKSGIFMSGGAFSATKTTGAREGTTYQSYFEYTSSSKGSYTSETLTQTADSTGVTFQFKSFQARGPEPTPEPTSGLLVLIGMAGLALKRKRV